MKEEYDKACSQILQLHTKKTGTICQDFASRLIVTMFFRHYAFTGPSGKIVTP